MIQQLNRTLIATLLFLSIGMSSAYAIPSFARQTGFECTQCHTIFPELTSTGRWFKLNGYTMTNNDKRSPLDNLSGMLQASYTKNADSVNGTTDVIDSTKDKKLSLDQASLFFGGKIIDSLGAFLQITYDGTGLIGNGKTNDIAHHIAADNADIRYVKDFKINDSDLLIGLTLNNNPSMQDIYNTTPTWSFPYSSSANVNSLSSTMVDGGLGQKVAGLGIYAMYDDLLYMEASGYQSNRHGGLLHALSYGAFRNDNTDLHGTAVYTRVALQKTIGDNFFMVGGYAMNSKKDPDITTSNNGQYDEYNDRALDAQYSYTSGSHIVTANITKIWEKQTLNNTFAVGGSGNPKNTLTTDKEKISYYYNQQYGVTIGAFSTCGSEDATLYANSVASSPNGSGKVIELDYLPHQKVKISLQYTAFDKYNGTKSNYDGLGRNAKDNNSLFLSAWMMF
jgi:hypothetical protein